MSDSVRPHRWQPTRLSSPWDSPGKNTGVGCHFLLQCMKVKSESEVAQLCPTLSNPMDCSPSGSPVHGIFQARVLEGVPLPSPPLLTGTSIHKAWGSDNDSCPQEMSYDRHLRNKFATQLTFRKPTAKGRLSLHPLRWGRKFRHTQNCPLKQVPQSCMAINRRIEN